MVTSCTKAAGGVIMGQVVDHHGLPERLPGRDVSPLTTPTSFAMSPAQWITWGALLGAAGVALGAFGAHGLPDWLANQGLDELARAKRLEWFETAVRYQMWHVIAIVAVGLVAARTEHRSGLLPGALFTAGILIFSGLLYVMAFTGIRWLGAIVPLGGLSLIGGWLALAWLARGVN